MVKSGERIGPEDGETDKGVEEPGKVRFFNKAKGAVDKRANEGERIERVKGDFEKVLGKLTDKITTVVVLKIKLSEVAIAFFEES